MMLATVALILASVASIRVGVEGGANEVLAYRQGVLVQRAPVLNGEARLEGLRPGSYDLLALGDGVASDPVLGVRATTGHRGASLFDARLVCRTARPVRVESEPGATLWVDGLPRLLAAPLVAEGLHKLVVDHGERVSSAGRLLRVAGPVRIRMPLLTGLVVTGRVRTTAGEPVPGARLRVFVDGFPAARGTSSGEDGSFGVAGVRGDVVSVEVSARGYATHLQRVVFFPGDQRARIEVVLRSGSSVTLAARSAAEGPLLDAEALLLPAWYERTLEEARLRANHHPRRRRGGLRMRFNGLTPGREYRLLVSAPGHLPGSTTTFRAPAAGGSLVLPAVVLRSAATVRGRIEVPSPLEAAGQVVLCRGPEGLATCRTDALGGFQFQGLDPGEHLLWARDLDGPTLKLVLAAGESATATLACRPGPPERVLAGEVADADGKPLPGVVVDALGRSVTTGADGEFEFREVPEGLSQFGVRFRPGPGCRALLEDPHLGHVEPRARPDVRLRVRLQRAGTLRLHFEDLPRPLSRATLHLASTEGYRRRLRLARGAKEVVVEDLPVGSYVAGLAAPGILGTTGELVNSVVGDAEPTRVRIVRGRSASGRLLLRTAVLRRDGLPEAHDTPLEEGWVTLFAVDALQALSSTPVEEDGSFLLEGLPLGPVILVGWAPGLPVAAVLLDLTSRNADGVELALQGATTAEVLVLGDGGAPFPGASVRIVHELGADLWDLEALGRFHRVVADERDFDALARLFRLNRSDAGRIVAPYVSPGSYRFHISAKGYKPQEVGVRARLAWTDTRIRELFPDLVGGMTARVRLERDAGQDPD